MTLKLVGVGRMWKRVSLCWVMAVFVGLTNTGGAWAFSDVPSDRHYYVAVTGLAVKGAVQGFPDGTFRPDALVSRAQFVKMIAAAVFLPPCDWDRNPFADISRSVSGSSHPESYVAAAHVAGIIEGKNARIFDPHAPLTRVQAMTIAVRASLKLQARELKPLPTGYRGRFADLDDPIHGENARLAEANHLLAGIDLLGWDPWAPATRSEAALIVWNVVNCFG